VVREQQEMNLLLVQEQTQVVMETLIQPEGHIITDPVAVVEQDQRDQTPALLTGEMDLLHL
jgi:hypothetical protein